MQLILLALLASLPLTTLVVSGRVFCLLARALRAKQHVIALLLAIAFVASWLLLAAIAVLWFALAVGHGAKPLHETLLLLGLSLLLVHGCGLGFWRLCRRFERRF